MLHFGSAKVNFQGCLGSVHRESILLRRALEIVQSNNEPGAAYNLRPRIEFGTRLRCL